MKPGLKLNSRLLPLLTIALAGVQIAFPSPIWKALLVALGGAWLVAYLWARSIQTGLRLQREMRFGWTQVGDKLEERFTLSNSGYFPIPWVEVIDHSDLPGYRASLGTCLGMADTNTWRTRGTCTRRGVYTLGDALLRSGDPLGIYTVEIPQPETAVLIVMPPVVPLPTIQVTPGGWLGEGRAIPNAVEKSANSGTVREYLPGDALRLIHWPTTARLNEPYVRLLEGAPAGAWWIVLDFDQRVQAGSEEDSTAEMGVILAASLADRGLRAHKEVGFLASGEPAVWMRPQAGEARRWEILRGLATLNPGDVPLARLLEKAGPTLGRQASLIVITSSTESDWLKPLTHLAWRGITPTVILMDAASFGAPRSAQPLAGLLASMNVAHQVVTRDLLENPALYPNLHGKREWRVTPTGRAIPINMPSNITWKRLG